MQEALTILNEVGHEFGLSAEIAHMITHIRHYERLTGECSGVGTILDWMETAVKDLSELANVFHPSSQTAEHFRHEAARLRYYVGRLRALGFLPTSPLAIHERPPLMGVGIDQGKAAHVSHRPARQARRALPRRPLGRPLMGCQMDGDRMPHGMLTSAEDMDRLRQVNA